MGKTSRQPRANRKVKKGPLKTGVPKERPGSFVVPSGYVDHDDPDSQCTMAVDAVNNLMAYYHYGIACDPGNAPEMELIEVTKITNLFFKGNLEVFHEAQRGLIHSVDWMKNLVAYLVNSNGVQEAISLLINPDMRENDPHYKVVDGSQRLTALLLYQFGFFPAPLPAYLVKGDAHKLRGFAPEKLKAIHTYFRLPAAVAQENTYARNYLIVRHGWYDITQGADGRLVCGPLVNDNAPPNVKAFFEVVRQSINEGRLVVKRPTMSGNTVVLNSYDLMSRIGMAKLVARVSRWSESLTNISNVLTHITRSTQTQYELLVQLGDNVVRWLKPIAADPKVLAAFGKVMKDPRAVLLSVLVRAFLLVDGLCKMVPSSSDWVLWSELYAVLQIKYGPETSRPSDIQRKRFEHALDTFEESYLEDIRSNRNMSEDSVAILVAYTYVNDSRKDSLGDDGTWRQNVAVELMRSPTENAKHKTLKKFINKEDEVRALHLASEVHAAMNKEGQRDLRKVLSSMIEHLGARREVREAGVDSQTDEDSEESEDEETEDEETEDEETEDQETTEEEQEEEEEEEEMQKDGGPETSIFSEGTKGTASAYTFQDNYEIAHTPGKDDYPEVSEHYL